MSSQELLKETEKAAGDPNLMKWHEYLSESGKDLLSLKKVLHVFCADEDFFYQDDLIPQDVEHQTEELDRLKQLQERDNHEVEVYRERQEQERLVGVHTQVGLPF
jgi:ribosomal 30S subunit maturation factor RimM